MAALRHLGHRGARANKLPGLRPRRRRLAATRGWVTRRPEHARAGSAAISCRAGVAVGAAGSVWREGAARGAAGGQSDAVNAGIALLPGLDDGVATSPDLERQGPGLTSTGRWVEDCDLRRALDGNIAGRNADKARCRAAIALRGPGGPVPAHDHSAEVPGVEVPSPDHEVKTAAASRGAGRR